MKQCLLRITLPEGVFETEVLKFESSDRKLLYRIYCKWRTLNKLLVSLGARSVNVPEGLSEGAFCLEMNMVQVIRSIPGANNSFDCFDLKSNKRIQVKACSVIPDLTSFGPRSKWDELYFLDFYRKGKWDGTFDIYIISNNEIYKRKVNSAKTFRYQQKEGKRPRFSIFEEIVLKKNLKPIKTGNLKW